MNLDTLAARPHTPSVTSVERILAILESLSAARSGMTLPEISRRLGLPKSSTHCLLLTLERGGYLIRDLRTRRYLFGLKLFSLANMAVMGIGLREQAAPSLQALAHRLHANVHMALREKSEAVIIEKIEPPGAPRIATWVGKRLGLHCSAVGKALLAFLPEDEVLRLVADHRLPRHNDNTITSIRRLQQEMAETRRRGYSIEDEEDEIGNRCIGAPVMTGSGQPFAAISVAGPTDQVDPQSVPHIAELVKQTAAEIARTVAPSWPTAANEGPRGWAPRSFGESGGPNANAQS